MSQRIVLRGSAEHLEMNGGIRRLETISLNLPFKCNYHCKKCASQERPFARAHERQALSLAEVKRINGKAAEAGARVFSFMGEGEFLMEPSMPELVLHAKSVGLTPFIFTNGSFLEGEKAEALAESGASLVVNVDSFQAEKYGELTGTSPRALGVVLENLQKVRKMFAETVEGSVRIARIGINMVVSKWNAGEIERAAAYCEANGFVFCANKPIHVGRATQHAEFVLTEKDRAMQEKYFRPYGTDLSGECAFIRHGLTYSLAGELLTCPYTLEMQGRHGKIDPENLLESQENVLRDLKLFELKFGNERCLLRHKKYLAFVNGAHQ